MDYDELFSDDDFVNSAPAMPKTKSVSSHNEVMDFDYLFIHST